MFTKQFWLGTLERAVKTFAQATVPLVTAEATGLLAVDWWLLLSISGAAALVSVLTSLGSAPFGDPGPSLAGETVDPVNTGLGEAELGASAAQDDLDAAIIDGGDPDGFDVDDDVALATSGDATVEELSDDDLDAPVEGPVTV